GFGDEDRGNLLIDRRLDRLQRNHAELRDIGGYPPLDAHPIALPAAHQNIHGKALHRLKVVCAGKFFALFRVGFERDFGAVGRQAVDLEPVRNGALGSFAGHWIISCSKGRKRSFPASSSSSVISLRPEFARMTYSAIGSAPFQASSSGRTLRRNA